MKVKNQNKIIKKYKNKIYYLLKTEFYYSSQ